MSLSRWFRDYLYIPLGGNRAARLADLPQPADRLRADRPLARRQLDVPDVGPLPRRLADHRAGQQVGPARVRPGALVASPRGHLPDRAGRLGAVPSRLAVGRRSLLPSDGRPAHRDDAGRSPRPDESGDCRHPPRVGRGVLTRNGEPGAAGSRKPLVGFRTTARVASLGVVLPIVLAYAFSNTFSPFLYFRF